MCSFGYIAEYKDCSQAAWTRRLWGWWWDFLVDRSRKRSRRMDRSWRHKQLQYRWQQLPGEKKKGVVARKPRQDLEKKTWWRRCELRIPSRPLWTMEKMRSCSHNARHWHCILRQVDLGTLLQQGRRRASSFVSFFFFSRQLCEADTYMKGTIPGAFSSPPRLLISKQPFLSEAAVATDFQWWRLRMIRRWNMKGEKLT